MLKLRKNKKGFTLVELIVVIAIMAVLAGTVAGVTVSQLNKQTNNTAKSEAQSLASDLHSFMIDYKLSAPENTTEGTWKAGDEISTATMLAHAVNDFVTENNQGNNIKVFSLGDEEAIAPKENKDIENKDTYKEDDKFVSFKAGEHKFYAVVYVEKAAAGGKPAVLKVRFCCLQKGSGKSQFPFADYTYSDVLADK